MRIRGKKEKVTGVTDGARLGTSRAAGATSLDWIETSCPGKDTALEQALRLLARWLVDAALPGAGVPWTRSPDASAKLDHEQQVHGLTERPRIGRPAGSEPPGATK